MEVKLEFIELYVVPLWRTVACAAVLSGRRANTVAGRRGALPSAFFDSWEGRRGRGVDSVEWRGLLGCVYDIAGVGGRSRRRVHFCRIPNNTIHGFSVF